mmetsp:Transcript_27714/g.58319  ORF Transcript_27714/g.58319 Transcript_27714/m.58319 type:complete len:522 (-) Transcript_27714:236-1801(-)
MANDALQPAAEVLIQGAQILGQLYANRSANSLRSISDSIGMGLGNQVYVLLNNFITSIASSRRLEVLSPIVNAVFEIPEIVNINSNRSAVCGIHTLHIQSSGTLRLWPMLLGYEHPEICMHWFHFPIEAKSVVADLLIKRGNLPSHIASNAYFQLAAASHFLLGHPKAEVQQNLALYKASVASACNSRLAVGASPTPQSTALAVVHLRTFSDVHCRRGVTDCGQCEAGYGTRCTLHHVSAALDHARSMQRGGARHKGSRSGSRGSPVLCVLILSDKESLALRVAQRIEADGQGDVRAVSEGSLQPPREQALGAATTGANAVPANLTWHTAHIQRQPVELQRSAAVLGWLTLRDAAYRVLTLGSTFGAAASYTLAQPRQEIIVDMECTPRDLQDLARLVSASYRFEMRSKPAKPVGKFNSWLLACDKSDRSTGVNKSACSWSQGRSVLAIHGEGSASARCQNRFGDLRSAQAACLNTAWCDGITQDSGSPCNFNITAAAAGLSCQKSQSPTMRFQEMLAGTP